MIRQANRFHGYGSLRYVYRHGQNVRSPLLGLRYSANSKRANFRVAVVVSKKVHKSAVTRNRIRRRLYEIIRQTTPPITQPYDLVFTVFQDSVKNAAADELSQEVKQLLQQAGVTGPNKGHDMIEPKAKGENKR